MKWLIFSDVHWCLDASIIRSRGKKYSTRLEHLIDSLNYLNTVAVEQDCVGMICAGDFFNKAQLLDEEITALRDISWNNLPCYFLCGNHDSSVIDLRFNVNKTLESDLHTVIQDPFNFISGDCQFHFVPYVAEINRQPLANYLLNVDKSKKQVVISHNDIQGIQYGNFESKAGFSIDEIEACCDLFLNGHLHNSEWITPKILNVGSLSCHNFTNDASKYKYGFWILDTDCDKSLMAAGLSFKQNEAGFNFYKLEISESKDIDKLDSIMNNSVLSISCSDSLVEACSSKLLELSSKIIEKRLIVRKSISEVNTVEQNKLLKIDHIKKLIEFCSTNLENTGILQEELAELSK